MNMIVLHANEVDPDGHGAVAGNRAQHIRKVLKAEPGQTVRIGLLNGPMGAATVARVDRHGVELDCVFDDRSPARPRIDLLLAMPRPKVMKRLWAQLAALGVGRIVLLRADKVERCYFDSHVLDPEFHTHLLIEGLQQARCTQLPEVLVRPLFKPFVEDELDSLFPDPLKLLADPSGGKRLGDVFATGMNPERAVLAIGPEGGWTPYELDRLKEHGFQLVGMGRRILRTDTATIGLLATLAELMARSAGSDG